MNIHIIVQEAKFNSLKLNCLFIILVQETNRDQSNEEPIENNFSLVSERIIVIYVFVLDFFGGSFRRESRHAFSQPSSRLNNWPLCFGCSWITVTEGDIVI